MNGYTSYGSFNPLYTEKVRDLKDHFVVRDRRIARDLLFWLTSFCDQHNMCFPSVSALSELTEVARKTVGRILARFIEIDYIRWHEYEDLFMQKRGVWMVSPLVRYVHAEVIEKVMTVWEMLDLNKSLTKKRELLDLKPEVSPDLSTDLSTNLPIRYHHHHHQTSSTKPLTPPPDIETREGHDLINQPEPVDDRPQFQSRSDELLTEQEFRIVKKLTKWGAGTSRKQAIALLTRKGAEWLENAMSAIDAEDGIKNKQGLLYARSKTDWEAPDKYDRYGVFT